MPAEGDRMFLHMGAFHTNKYSDSAGSRIAREHPATRDRVFSVAPAWGEGSVIWYGEPIELEPSPPVVASALAASPSDPYFVSSSRPSRACVSNPLASQIEEVAGGTRAETYDGYLHVRRLTPENRPDEATIQMRALGPLSQFWRARERVQLLEKRRLGVVR
jgi:hypothetical protein